MRRLAIAAATLAAIPFLTGCSDPPPLGPTGEPVALRFAFYPNVTHAQALIGVARGDFQKSIGTNVELITKTFNSGPSAIEAMYSGYLDIAYIGPSPTLNGYLQSNGKEVRVIAGSAINGVLVVGNKKRGITTMQELVGGQIATPGYGNTQDISAKYFLTHKFGATLKSDGGNTAIIPMANPDILTLFAKNEIDGAWVPEPWGSRLVYKGLATVVAEEKQFWSDGTFPMTNIIARRDFVEKHPELVSRFLQAHIRITRELQADPQAFSDIINDELERITTKRLADEVIAGALNRTGFDIKPEAESFERFFMMGKEVGIISEKNFHADNLIVPGPLQQALAAVESTDKNTTAGLQL